jgi:hypothetical protein
MTLDPDGCLALLCAVARQWARDAARDPHELALLAGWLDMAPGDLLARLAPAHKSRHAGGKNR